MRPRILANAVLSRPQPRVPSDAPRSPSSTCSPADHHLGGPRRSAVHPGRRGDAGFRQDPKGRRAAERAGHVRPRGHHPLWATEFWWETDPPSPSGVHPRTQARWMPEALYLLWKQGVKVAINVQIRDEQEYQGFPFDPLTSGLFFFDGEPKPSASRLQVPLITERRSPNRLLAWGKAPSAGVVRIQVKRRGRTANAQRGSGSGRATCSRDGCECAATAGCGRASARNGARSGASVGRDGRVRSDAQRKSRETGGTLMGEVGLVPGVEIGAAVR